MRSFRSICFSAAAVVICLSDGAAQVAPSLQVDTLAIRAHTRFLAADSLLGRGTGTEGERIAASYIASQVQRLGLEPLADTGFLLPIPLRSARVAPASQVTVRAGADSLIFDNVADFIANTGGPGAFRSFEGEAVLFGQAVHALRRVQDAGSLARRVAVFLGPLGGPALDLIPALDAAGVAGVIVLVPDPAQYDLYVRSRGDARFFVDADVHDPVWQPRLPVLIAGPRLTEALLSGAPVPPGLIEGDAAAALDLARTVAARIDAGIEHVPAANVGAVLRGSDPARADHYIVYTAHYDHLGISTPDAAGDSIYNGFSDNAAGVAMLLAIAEALRDRPPPRSVAFVFFTGEERGLLGSSYMAAHPPFRLENIDALINLDAGAPPAPPVSWRVAGGAGTALGVTAQHVARRHGWDVSLSPASPNSDYWPFLQRGVPSIFIIPGTEWENTTPDRRDALRQQWDRYHRADDHWHPDFPFSGLKRYAEFALLVGLDVANR